MLIAFFLYGFYSVIYSFNFWRYQIRIAGDDWQCEMNQMWEEINWGWIEMQIAL